MLTTGRAMLLMSRGCCRSGPRPPWQKNTRPLSSAASGSASNTCITASQADSVLRRWHSPQKPNRTCARDEERSVSRVRACALRAARGQRAHRDFGALVVATQQVDMGGVPQFEGQQRGHDFQPHGPCVR